MKNIAVNNLGYTGIVTISRYAKGKKVVLARKHNTGNTPLFDFISNCLIGNFTAARLRRPSKIMLLKSEESQKEGNGKTYSSRSSFIYLQTTPERRDISGNSSVCYSFIITRALMENPDFNCIGLYPDTTEDENDFAAVCDISLEEGVSFSPSSVLVVDWELIFSNKEEI